MSKVRTGPAHFPLRLLNGFISPFSNRRRLVHVSGVGRGGFLSPWREWGEPAGSSTYRLRPALLLRLPPARFLPGLDEFPPPWSVFIVKIRVKPQDEVCLCCSDTGRSHNDLLHQGEVGVLLRLDLHLFQTVLEVTADPCLSMGANLVISLQPEMQRIKVRYTLGPCLDSRHRLG